MSFLGAALGAGGSILGGLFSGNAAQEAAETQAKAMRYAADIQKQQYQQNTQNAQPYMQAGTNALSSYGNAIGLNGSDAQSQFMNNFQQSPFFNQMVKNAGDATMNQYAAKGMNGGNLLNALYQQNAGLWNQGYQNNLSQLAGVAGQGLSATNALAGTGTQLAQGQSNLISGAGAAMGAGQMGMGNAIGGALNNAGIFAMLGSNGSKSGFGGLGGLGSLGGFLGGGASA